MRKEEQEYCRDCQKKKYAFEAGKSIWVHKAPVSQGIYRFKYKNRRCYGEIFAAEMAAELGDTVKQWKIEEIIPVPGYYYEWYGCEEGCQNSRKAIK